MQFNHDGPDQVSWQSAFWALVPIQLSVMTQPSGRVLDLPARLRTYARSSPIMCAFDAASKLIEFGAILWYYGFDFQMAAVALVEEAYGDGEPEKLGIQAVEDLGFIRALLFILGALPQVVKLLSSRGIPWTQAWTVMFLASYIVTEAMHILHDHSFFDTSRIDFRRIRYQSLNPQRIVSQSSLFRRIRYVFTILSVCSQVALLIWVYFDVFDLARFSRVIQHGAIFSVLLFPLWIFLFFLTYCLITGAVWLLLLGASEFIFDRSEFLAMIISLHGSLLFAGVVLWKVLSAPDIVGMSFPFFALCILVPSFIAAGRFLIRFEFFRRNVFLHPQSIRLGYADRDEWAQSNSFAAWGMFLITFVLGMLWYALRYDPEGTYKPEWINKLG
ncbi:hypothetical protein N0V90_011829 [Kalmusia sp. IMI 367209]|nr:hypothetical protein N0V90_011829 [Kalmusia sp. IMI 367209]